MNRALERRIAEIESQVVALTPAAPSGLEWIVALTDDELDEVEVLYRRHADAGTTPSDAERLRALGLYATAMARMVAGSETT